MTIAPKRSLATLAELELSNQCVVVCDLREWRSPQSPAWFLLKGSQQEIGSSLAELLGDADVGRLDDFGGVCETFLCAHDEYVAAPPTIAGSAAVFSFTPKKRLLAEGNEMARVARAAGYLVLIMSVQKHDKFGKVWVLQGLLQHLRGEALTYYEDTNTIIDELKSLPEHPMIVAIHVQAPGFEDHVAKFADRTVTQDEYRQEVLA